MKYTKIIAITVLTLIASVAVPFSFVFANSVAGSSVSCANGTTLSLAETRSAIYSGQIVIHLSTNATTGKASATVTNNTNCILPVSLISYQMFDTSLGDQQYFDGGTIVNIAPCTTQTVTVNLPSCMAQIDLYYGAGPHVLYNDNRSADQTIGFIFYENSSTGFSNAVGNFCKLPPPPPPVSTSTPPVVPPPVSTSTALIISCAPNSSTVTTGQNVMWSASASGGSGSGYAYSWSGDENLTGSSSTTTISYAAAGTENAMVTVKDSNNKTASAECSVVVTTPAPPGAFGNPGVTCFANPISVQTGDTVTWNANATGGTGLYTYAWMGDDSFTASTSVATHVYTTAGTKNATIVITDSNGRTATNQCVAVVNSTPTTVSTSPTSTPPTTTPTTVATPPSTPTTVGAVLGTTSVAVTASSVTPNQVAGVYLTQVPYTGLKENAVGALAAATLLGAAGFVGFMYNKKRAAYAYAMGAKEVQAASHIAQADQKISFETSVQEYARSKSTSISADALQSIANVSRSIDEAKAIIDHTIAAHPGNEWFLMTVQSIKKAYPYM